VGGRHLPSGGGGGIFQTLDFLFRRSVSVWTVQVRHVLGFFRNFVYKLQIVVHQPLLFRAVSVQARHMLQHERGGGAGGGGRGGIKEEEGRWRNGAANKSLVFVAASVSHQSE